VPLTIGLRTPRWLRAKLVMPTKSSLRKAHTVEQFRVARVGMEGVIFRATDPQNYFAWFVFDGTVQLVKHLSAQHGMINRRGHVALLKEIFQTRLIESILCGTEINVGELRRSTNDELPGGINIP
jgi:hypothetical protein